MKAIWNGQIIAESDDTVVIDNNHYFPQDSLNMDFFSGSDYTTVCGWKGLANYYTVTVNGADNKDSAWYYASPKPKAQSIENRVAFWRGIKVVSE
jgi:uncharacterized protein (DUF427 family)